MSELEVTKESLERRLLSNLLHSEDYSAKALFHLKKEFFEWNENREIFKMIADYATKYNKVPTKIELEINISDVDIKHVNDEEKETIEHVISSLSTTPDNIDWALDKTETWIKSAGQRCTLSKCIKGSHINLDDQSIIDLQYYKNFNIRDNDGDRIKLKLNTITHIFEQGKTLKEQLANPPYRIKHMLPENGVGVLTGPSTTGKTFMIDHMIAHLITGTKYFGKRVKPCNVLYVYAEGSAVDIDLRLEAHTQYYDNDDFNTKDHRLHIAPCIWNLCDESIIPEIMNYITKYDIKFIVLETLGAMLMDGTVNDDEVVRKYLAGAKNIADQCNCTLLIVHHSPKAGTSDYLGSVTIKNNPDFLWILWKLNDEGKRDGNYKAKEIMLSLYCDKCKFGRDGWDYKLLRKEVVIGIDDEGDEMTSLVVENLTPEQVEEFMASGKAAKKATKTELSGNALKLETLRQDCFGGRNVISKAELRKAARGHSISKHDSDDTIRLLAERGVDSLQKAGVKVEFTGQEIVWADNAVKVAINDDMFVA